MKIRLKVSVKVRGGRVFTPGVYDSEIEAYSPLFDVLDLDSESDAFESLTPIPAVVEDLPPDDLGGDGDSDEDSDEDEVIEEDGVEEEEAVEEEEVEEKPKKKKGNKKKGK